MPKIPLNQIYGEPQEGGGLLVDVKELASLYRSIGRSGGAGISPSLRLDIQTRLLAAAPALEAHLFNTCDSCGHKKAIEGSSSER